MTAVALPMTAAPAAVGGAPRPAGELGFALYVGAGEGQDASQLAAVAEAVLRLVSEMAPDAAIHSALALGPRSSKGAVVARLREDLTGEAPAAVPARQRARAAWRGTKKPSVVLDVDARELTVHGRPVPLAHREFDLLEYLLSHPRHAVSREELLRTVWRDGAPGDHTRTIDVHVRRLRDKLGGCLQIATVRGVGYRYDPTPAIVLVGSGDAG